MAARFSTNNQSMTSCTASAAACSSARICLVLDTAVLAVSIFVVLICLRLQLLIT